MLPGAAIAAYTLWDKNAVGAVGLSPIAYYWGTNLATAALLTPVALRAREDLRLAWTTSRMRAAGVGLLSPLAYVLVLYALVDAPVSYVAPARESSIVVGTLLGIFVLHEQDRGRRLAAAAAILIGVFLLTLGCPRRPGAQPPDYFAGSSFGRCFAPSRAGPAPRTRTGRPASARRR